MPAVDSHNAVHAVFPSPVPSLKVGAASGVGGFLIGGGVGILRSAHPGLVATFTGAQFFVLGSSFVYSRELILRTALPDTSRKSKLISSTAAGALSGAAAGAFYGRVNSVAGACVFGALGHLGQRYLHSVASRPATPSDPRPVWERLMDSRWIPFRPISNSQYEVLLTDKLIKVEAEISMIDEKLSALRQKEEVSSAKSGLSQSS